MDWPYNLLEDVFDKPFQGWVTDKHREDIFEVINGLPDETMRRCILGYYREGLTYKRLTEELGLKLSSVYACKMKALRELEQPQRANILRYGKELTEAEDVIHKKEAELKLKLSDIKAKETELKLKLYIIKNTEARIEQLEKRVKALQVEAKKSGQIDILAEASKLPVMSWPITRLNLGSRAYTVLLREHYGTLGDVVSLIIDGGLFKLNGMGEKAATDIVSTIKEETGCDLSNFVRQPRGK